MTGQVASPAGGWGDGYFAAAPCGCAEGWLKDDKTHRPGCLREGEDGVVIDHSPRPWLDRQMGPVSEPTISHEDAAAICATVWPDREAAQKRAGVLEEAGWYVVGRFPAHLDGRVIIASVHHPDPANSTSPGDIMHWETR